MNDKHEFGHTWRVVAIFSHNISDHSDISPFLQVRCTQCCEIRILQGEFIPKI